MRKSLFFSNKFHLIFDIIGCALVTRSIYYIINGKFFAHQEREGLELLLTFTNWGMFMTALFFYSSFLLNFLNSSFLEKLRKKVLHIAVSCEFVIFVFYWIFLGHKDIPVIVNLEDKNQAIFELINSIVKHILYPLLTWFVVLTEDIKFQDETHIWVNVMYVSYSLVNYFGVLKLGRPIYPMVNYQCWRTGIYIGIAYLLVRGGYWVSFKCSQSVCTRVSMLKDK